MASIRLDDVTCDFPRGVRAVDGLSLEVHDGELLVLLGPSGCGKTTTLRLIAGLESPSSGTISLGSRVVNGLPPSERDVAMVFQSFALYEQLTVRDNLGFGLRLREGGSRLALWASRFLGPSRFRERQEKEQQLRQRIEEVAGLLGLGSLLDRRPGELSGGERQRVALGRAIARRPAVYLLDEPLSSLDARLRVEMREELKALHRRLGATMIYVTHDQHEAFCLADRLAVMRAGRILQIDRPMAVYRRPAHRFVADAVGFPPMNFIDGQLEARDGRVQFRRGSWTLEFGGTGGPGGAAGPGGVPGLDSTPGLVVQHGALRAVTLGVRAEELVLSRDPASPRERCFAARVVSIEPLGAFQVVHLKCEVGEGQPLGLVSQVGGQEAVTVGEAIFVSLPIGRGVCFDAESGARLTLDA